MDDFFEEQSSPAVRGTVATMAVELTYEADAFVDAIVAKIAHDRHRQVDRLLTDAIEKKVRELVDDAIKVQISDLVAQILIDGFRTTDPYGNQTGANITARSLIIDTLSGKERYGRTSLPNIVSEVVKKRFEPEIEAATKTIRGMVDEEIKGRLNDALRNALGQR